MTVYDIVKMLDLQVFGGQQGLTKQISGGYTSDLLSDVMGNANEGTVWITLQTHKNIMAIASLKDLAAIILVKGLKPEKDTLEKCNEEGIPILGSRAESFELSGKVYNLLQMKKA
jgi:predicted transcriptional regulator